MAVSSESSAQEQKPANLEPNPPSPSASTASTLPVEAHAQTEKPSSEPLKFPLSKLDTKSSSTHSRPSHELDQKPVPEVDETAEFKGEVDTNNDIPSAALVKQIGDHVVLDKDGRSVPFRNVYSGPNVVRRVLVIFIRHFLCGNCQEYVRTLSSTPSLTPSSLLSLSPPTFICIIGCGSPSMIPSYAATTSCPYPIYTDPTKQIYNSLKMIRTFSAGQSQPEYMHKSLFGLAVKSVVQGVKEASKGKLFNRNASWGGVDLGQVGGEFLFEGAGGGYSPGGISPGETPESEISTPNANSYQNSGAKGGDYLNAGQRREEEKVVTWCHRMKNTRDHAEVQTIMAVLGVDSEAERKRKELGERKLTGMSARSAKSFASSVQGEGDKELEVPTSVVAR